jgi:hypothetical protein
MRKRALAREIDGGESTAVQALRRRLRTGKPRRPGEDGEDGERSKCNE